MRCRARPSEDATPWGRVRTKKGFEIQPYAWQHESWNAEMEWNHAEKALRQGENSISLETELSYSVAATLQEWEKPWVEVPRFLKNCGYLLRPRYRKRWTPSFNEIQSMEEYGEDSIILPERHGHLVNDAIRLTDGALVEIEQMRRDCADAHLLALLSSCCTDRTIQNHYVPVLEIFDDYRDQDTIYVVTPFLRPFNSPPFDTIGDVVDFTTQILEGLRFFHERGIAHGNITNESVKVDAREIFPDGFHPVALNHSADCTTEAWHIPRLLSAQSVKYYFVGFDMCHIDPSIRYGAPDTPTPILLDVPDMATARQNDIMELGTLLGTQAYERYANVEFIRPLVSLMASAEVEQRPDIANLVEHWRRIRQDIHPLFHVWRLRPRPEAWWLHVVFGIIDLVRLALSFPARHIMHFRIVRLIVSRLCML